MPAEFITANRALDKALVKAASGSTIYWLQNGKIYHVLSPDLISTMQNGGITGWGLPYVTTVPFLDGYTVGPDVYDDKNSGSNRLLLKAKGTLRIYLITDRKKEYMPTFDEIKRRGLDRRDVIEVTSSILDSISLLQQVPVIAPGQGAPNATVEQAISSAVGAPVAGAASSLSSIAAAPTALFGSATQVVKSTTSAVTGAHGYYQLFEGGSVQYVEDGASAGRTFTVQGDVYEQWGIQGYAGGQLGFPNGNLIAVTSITGVKGEYQPFEGGVIVRHGGFTLVVSGKIYQKWQAHGGNTGLLGFPTGEQLSATSGFRTPGTYQRFEKGSIQLVSDSVFSVIGYFHKEWSQHGTAGVAVAGDALDTGHTTWAGFPTTDMYTVNGLNRQDFEGGFISSPVNSTTPPNFTTTSYPNGLNVKVQEDGSTLIFWRNQGTLPSGLLILRQGSPTEIVATLELYQRSFVDTSAIPGSPTEIIASLDPYQTSFVDTTAIPGHPYRYWVQSYHESAESPPSNEATVNLLPTSAPRTGQTSCFDSLGAGVACSGTGQDGELRSGVSWPNPRFEDTDGVTMTDTLTGLSWSREANLITSHNPELDTDAPVGDGLVTWQHALDYVTKLNAEGYLGYRDWRLPNSNELLSLAQYSATNGAGWLAAQGFVSMSNDGRPYWTSTVVGRDTASAWTVNPSEGTLGTKARSGLGLVWPVRGVSFGSATVLKTGVTTSYAAGDDGALRLGLTVPAPRFVENSSGLVTDALTSLIWSRSTNAPGPAACGPGLIKTWQAALEYTQCLNRNSYLGDTDWRLPSIKELQTLTDFSRSLPVLPAGHPFTAVATTLTSTYWSSTTAPGASGEALALNMGTGEVTRSSKAVPQFVWPVRGGKTLPTLVGVTPAAHIFNRGGETLEATLTNQLDAPVTVTSWTTTNPIFTVAAGGSKPCASLTPTLAKSESCTVVVTFGPTVSFGAFYTGALKISGTAGVSVRDSYLPLSAPAVFPLYGSVYDLSSGRPIAAAIISVTGGTSVATDPDGTWRFSTLSPGVYQVSVTKSGYQGATFSTVIIPASPPGKLLNVGLATPGPLNISTRTLPPAEIGLPFNSRVQISGGVPPYTFSVASGALPPGFALDPVFGTVSGIPATVGSYPFTAKVTDKVGAIAQWSFTIAIETPIDFVTTSTLPRATRSSSYPFTFQAAGGTGALTYSVTAGTLPGGMILNQNGTLSGVPNASATAAFTVTATDSAGRSASRQFLLAVDEPLGQGSGLMSDGLAGSPYNQTVTATGGLPPYHWLLASGALPPGLSLGAGGVITGTPERSGSWAAVVAVADSWGRMNYQVHRITVVEPLNILTTYLPNGYLGEFYGETIRLSGGKPPFHFTKSGDLPTGLTLDLTTGMIFGVPTVGALTNSDVTVSDSTWPTPQSRTGSLSLRADTLLTVITPALLSSGLKGQEYPMVTLAAKGGPAPYSWSVVGGYLPEGLTLNTTTGTISGTPRDQGDFRVAVRVTDKAGAATGTPDNPDKEFFLHVSNPLAITTVALPTGGVGAPYVTLLDAVGGIKPYTWSIKSGVLPSGLTLDGGTGVLAGTPASASAQTVIFEALDSDSPPRKAVRTLTLSITDQLTLFEPTLPDARINQPYAAHLHAQLGVPRYSWRLTGGGLPPGLFLNENAAYATLEGIPTADGVYTFTLEVGDVASPGGQDARQFTMNIQPDLLLTTTALPSAISGLPYTTAIAAAGGAPPLRFTVVQGVIPPGLTFNSDTGAFSGVTTLPVGQSAVFTVRVTDSGYPMASVERQFTVFAVDPLVITTSVIQGAVQKSFHTVTFSGQGGCCHIPGAGLTAPCRRA